VPDHAPAQLALIELDRVIAALPPRTLVLGSAQPFQARPRDPAPAIEQHPRLLVGLSGEHRYLCSRAGERVEATLPAGHALYLAPHAWSAPYRRSPCRFLGIVFRRTFMRVLVGEYTGGSARPMVIAHHTRRPLAGAGGALVHALDALAEGGGEEDAARETFCALLRLARRHLADDAAQAQAEKPGAALWRAALELMHQRYAEDIGREAIARELRLHPNYLSAVAREHGGTTLRDALQAIRLEHARHLVRATDLTLAEIASRCGYAGPGYLGKAFRRALGVAPGSLRRGQR
jgi:AraC-like DNA-binding protein